MNHCVACKADLTDDELACPACGTEVVIEATRARGSADSTADVIDGKWVIEKTLGQGGMGTVYLARDLDLGRRVAIKMLSRGLVDNAELVTRFEREARMMARLDHPNLVPVYAVGRRDKTPFIVMKLLEGRSLSEFISGQQRLSSAELLSVVRQLCEGLTFVHSQRVVHRDLKPANIFLSSAGHVTLLDLGVARDTDNNMTRTGMLMGTPRYMAPEQILGKHAEASADLYALTLVVFELVTGRPPFEAETDFELMRAHVDLAPQDAATIVALPPGVSAVLQRGLAKAPADRYASARDFFTAFETAWNSGPPVHIVAKAPLEPARATPAPRAPTPSPRGGEVTTVGEVSDEQLAGLRRSKLPVFGALGALVLGGLALATLRPWAGDEAPPTPVPEPEPIAVVAPPPKVIEKPPEPVVETPKPEPVAVVVETPKKVAPKVEAPRSAEVTFLCKVKGVPAPAFVDVDGLRLRATPFRHSLSAGPHTVVFHRDGAPSVTRKINVVGGESQKVVVEMTQ